MQASSSKDDEENKPDVEPIKTICRCCLSTERRVLDISLFVSHFLDLAGVNVSEADGLPPWLCYECSALLQKSVRFKHKLLKANTMLCDYLLRCAPFPMDAEDPELSKYSTPNLRETHTLTFDNTGKSKLGFQKLLEHEKKPIVSALDAIALSYVQNIVQVNKDEHRSDLVKVELDTFSDYEDNITLDEFRTTAAKSSEDNPVTSDAEVVVKTESEDKAPKKKKRTKKKEEDMGEKMKQKRKRLENNRIVYRMSEELKAKMIALWREGVPVTTIADDLGCTRKTVYLWTRRWDREGNVKSRVSMGRPRKTTPAQDQALVDAVRYQHLVNTTTLAAPFEVSSSTIRRRLEENGIIQSQKELTLGEKALRLQYAQRYLHYDFESVAFIDEKLFVAKAGGLEIHSTSRSETTRVTIGFWGWMNGSGPIELCDLAGRLNSQQYLDLLRDLFLPSARIVYPDGHKIVFTQELSAHKRRKVEAWIESQGDLELIRLPPKSPDLNPMEDVWSVIVKDFDSTIPPTNHQLWVHVRQHWDKLRGTDFCASLVKSMKDRLQAVIDADGGYTKY